MGMGDEIMVTGEVKRKAAGTTRRFCIRDGRATRPPHRWCDIWAGNPRIAMPGQPYDDVIENHGGRRPYIAGKGAKLWQWKVYGPEPGEIFLNDAERALGMQAAGAVVIQPGIKAAASPNKQWGLGRWQELINKGRDIPWLQVGAGDEPRLSGVPFLQTRTFREACGVLAGAKAAVLQEGGLHHAAAALGVPAVVIFGGFIAPAVTGYRTQRNLFEGGVDHPLGCGMRILCRHCESAMEAIKPRRVLHELEELISG